MYIPVLYPFAFQGQQLNSDLGLFNGVANDDGLNPGSNAFFASSDTSASGSSAYVRLTPSAAIPEPASVLLVGTGLAAAITVHLTLTATQYDDTYRRAQAARVSVPEVIRRAVAAAGRRRATPTDPDE